MDPSGCFSVPPALLREPSSVLTRASATWLKDQAHKSPFSQLVPLGRRSVVVLFQDDPCLAPLGAPSLWIQYFISMRADRSVSSETHVYTKRAGSCMWRGINLGERVSCREGQPSDLAACADPVDQRGGAQRRERNDPLGSDFRCRYFSLLTVMMMMMVIQSHVGYMQQWKNDIRCSAYIKYEIKLQFSCNVHI